MNVQTDSLPVSDSTDAELGRRYIAIASGKGGVGKTWLSVTLAHALAARDRRVLVFDGDLGLANVDIQLGLNVDHDLGDVARGRRAMRDAITRCQATGFDVIAGRSGSGDLANATETVRDLIWAQLRRVARDYDHVIVDMGAGIERHVLEACPDGARQVVVVSPDPTSITDAYAHIKTVLLERAASGIDVVVNLAGERKEGERTFKTLARACQNFLSFTPRLLGIVHQDPQVAQAIRRQTPLLTRHPACRAAADVEALAAAILRPGT